MADDDLYALAAATPGWLNWDWSGLENYDPQNDWGFLNPGYMVGAYNEIPPLDNAATEGSTTTGLVPNNTALEQQNGQWTEAAGFIPHGWVADGSWANAPVVENLATSTSAFLNPLELPNPFPLDQHTFYALPSSSLAIPAPSDVVEEPEPALSNSSPHYDTSVPSFGSAAEPGGGQPESLQEPPQAPLEIVEYVPPAKGGAKRKRGPDHETPLDMTRAGAKGKRDLDNENPWVIQREYRHQDTGDVQGIVATYAKNKKIRVRGPMDEQSRKSMHLVRVVGACARCHRLKKKCILANNPYEPCASCRAAKPYILKMPCFQSKLSEAAFFRIRPAAGVPLDATNRKQVFDELSDIVQPLGEVHTLRLTQDFSTQVSVLASKFIPMDGDKTAYTWNTEAGPQTLEMPPYCLTSIEATKAKMAQYVEATGYRIIQANLECEDDITWDTFSMAIRFADPKRNSMVGRALKLWSASRMIERPWRMCGDDTLGLEPIDPVQYPGCPYADAIPVPPIMGAQLDQVVIQGILGPLRSKILDEFQALVQNAKPESWFELYLTAFVLLNSVEMTSAHSGRWAKKFGWLQRYSNYSQMEGFFHGCKIVLAHFHFVCKGAVPLKIDWRDPKAAKFAKLDKEQVLFMKETQKKIREKEEQVLALRSRRKYDNALYWCHQLFFEDWNGGVTVIEEELA